MQNRVQRPIIVRRKNLSSSNLPAKRRVGNGPSMSLATSRNGCFEFRLPIILPYFLVMFFSVWQRLHSLQISSAVFSNPFIKRNLLELSTCGILPRDPFLYETLSTFPSGSSPVSIVFCPCRITHFQMS